MFKLKKSPREEKMGCLFALIGIFMGLMYNNWSAGEHARVHQAADPAAGVCGLPYLAGMLGGMLISRFVLPKDSPVDE